jgi:hypothetical protein
MAQTPRNPPPKKPHSVWLCVFEVADSGQQRRFREKPNVRVRAVGIEPGPKLDAWVAISPSARKQKLKQVLYDEMPGRDQLGGLTRPLQRPGQNARIEDALSRLREQLRCRKYTVDGDARIWRLYVVDLDAAKLRKKPEGMAGFVYVGETTLDPEERAEQHRLGPNYRWKRKPAYSKPCHGYFKMLRLDMVPQQFRKPYFCKSAALLAESKMRLYFEDKGYKVFGGKDRLDRLKDRTVEDQD